MRIYLDSNIFISYIREEIGRNFRNLAGEAEHFFNQVSEKQHTLIISDLFIQETKKHCFMNKKELHDFFVKKSICIDFVEDSMEIPRELLSRGLHYSDAWHTATALRNTCNAIATFNIQDFKKIQDKIGIIDIKLL